MNTLENIRRREKERNPDIDVYYDDVDNWLYYVNDEGIMTVVFNANGIEDFYYRSHFENGEGAGYKFQSLVQRGTYGKVDSSFMLSKLPQRFLEIAQSYQFSRDEMNIDFEADNYENKYDCIQLPDYL